MHSLTEQFIDNAWVPSRAEARRPVIDPYHETVIAEVTAGDPADVEAAVAAAPFLIPFPVIAVALITTLEQRTAHQAQVFRLLVKVPHK